ncbi:MULTISPECIES: hypothetical protein [Prochlorococcus]|uniref:hypothetical protein n=1 Tax=Prochlorococcus TaxID=1218 RepID=UPI000533B45A|nr:MULTISPECIES: hypothetical protein [Prochlorococcus]KGG12627.1 hypothetical protein EV05_1839 [Prochlorococcus sp. MIT 0601]
MSLDPQNIERLQELRRQLPEKLPAPEKVPKKKDTSNLQLHRIETEENPQELFKELIKASPNGEVPQHLISRLKELETKFLADTNSRESKSKKLINFNESRQLEDLYVPFKKLLLEEEED